MSEPTLYERLSDEFDHVYQLPGRGGSPPLDYVSGEQCISRLNEVLGVDGWSFEVKDHGYNQEADEIWVIGRLTVYVRTGDGERTIVKEQAGSQEVKRLRQSNDPVEIGFDLKGAITDALKKCATLIGVGLYLYDRDRKAGGAASSPAPARAPNPTPTAPTTTAASTLSKSDAIPDPDAPATPDQREWYDVKLGEARKLHLNVDRFKLPEKITRARIVELGNELRDLIKSERDRKGIRPAGGGA